MAKKVKLREVDADNWDDVAALELRPDQEDFVYSNLYSIAESKFDRAATPTAIYAGKKLVGFAMYKSLEEDDAPFDYSIYRLMIDRRHQGKGYGRAALTLILRRIQDDPGWRRILICYEPANTDGARLYKSLGFRELGLDEHGEMIAEIRRGA